eukprot:166300-Chlamydomonas_euryale.AAC.1
MPSCTFCRTSTLPYFHTTSCVQLGGEAGDVRARLEAEQSRAKKLLEQVWGRPFKSLLLDTPLPPVHTFTPQHTVGILPNLHSSTHRRVPSTPSLLNTPYAPFTSDTLLKEMITSSHISQPLSHTSTHRPICPCRLATGHMGHMGHHTWATPRL